MHDGRGERAGRGVIAPRFRTVVEMLRTRVATQACEVAFTFIDLRGERVDVTYDTLDRQARALAVALGDVTQAGDRVLLLHPPGPDFIAALFGCMYAGVISVPAFIPRAERHWDRLAAISKDSGARVALSTREVAQRVEEKGDMEVQWLTSAASGPGLEEGWRSPTLTPDDLALLQYTSGSTSEPKGVMVSHGNILHNAEQIRRAFGEKPSSHVVHWLPPYHDMGLIGGILTPFYCDYTAVLMRPERFLMRPHSWLEAISGHQQVVSGAPNFAYDLCVDKIPPPQRRELDLSGWRLAYCGAEPIRAETLDRFAAAFGPSGFRPEAFYACYGLAESTLLVTGSDLAKPPARLQVNEGRGRPARELVGCGRAQAGTEVLVVDPERRVVCLPGQIGEVWLAGGSVAQGYWEHPEASRARFSATLQDGREPYLRTGDLGMLVDGELFVTGRLMELIIVDGKNLYPQDIEQTVGASHPALAGRRSAAFAVTLGRHEAIVVVQEFRGRPGSSYTEMCLAIRAAVAQAHDHPLAVVAFTKELPTTTSGKIERRACRLALLEGRLSVSWSWGLERLATHVNKSNS